jgi:hypothetical protein
MSVLKGLLIFFLCLLLDCAHDGYENNLESEARVITNKVDTPTSLCGIIELQNYNEHLQKF